MIRNEQNRSALDPAARSLAVRQRATPKPYFDPAPVILAASILVGGIALSALVADIAFLMGPPL